jgi:hypothetical protein
MLPRSLPRPEALASMWPLTTRKAAFCRAFRCAEEDSNLHPVSLDQAINLARRVSYPSESRQIVRIVPPRGRYGHIGRSGCCHGCCHEPTLEHQRGSSRMIGRRRDWRDAQHVRRLVASKRRRQRSPAVNGNRKVHRFREPKVLHRGMRAGAVGEARTVGHESSVEGVCRVGLTFGALSVPRSRRR